MLSDAFSIVEFLDKAKCNNYQRVLTLAHREATDVERFLYKKQSVSAGDTKLREYATVLKDFISYMRYGIKTRKVRPLDLEHFKTLREMSASTLRR
ncbi:MAG: hypothetical protein PVG41_20510 [Desulfobacteraceae bacterium]|jgi:hypothetical protein